LQFGRCKGTGLLTPGNVAPRSNMFLSVITN
jgi:hypothetical protein